MYIIPLRIERLETLSGHVQPGFFVRNRANKVLAIGAYSRDPFVMPSRKRYARDLGLCQAIAALTGLPMKWNLTWYCNHVTSGTNQELMHQVRKLRRTR
jgi:hypothetical protein